MIERRVFDVDIDVNSKCDRSSYGTRAMIYNDELQKILPHPSGVYLEEVPIDPETNNTAFDYVYGNKTGFQKVDILTNKAYDRFSSKDELIRFLSMEPDWDRLREEDFVEKLPHISTHYDVVSMLQPQSIEDLADLLALIRPAKLKYIPEYRRNKNKVRRNLYKRPNNGTAYFKRSHAISYATMIVAVMNKLTHSSIVKL